MITYFLRKNTFFNFVTIFSFLIFIFFISHIFIGERSIWKIFLLNSQISSASKEYKQLIHNKKILLSEINLLKDYNLDADYVTEISFDLLGLIQSDQIVININN